MNENHRTGAYGLRFEPAIAWKIQIGIQISRGREQHLNPLAESKRRQ